MSRKYEAIDLMKFRVSYSRKQYEQWLTQCLKTRNVDELANTMYAIQGGIDDLAKNKLNTEKNIVWALGLIKSIEKVVKAIFREMYPSVLDNTGLVDPKTMTDYNKHKAAKKKRDLAFELFLRGRSY